MGEELRCPACAESERLTGAEVDDHIEVTCGTCGPRWLRGSPRCRTCGGDEVVTRLGLMTRHPRGNQLAVVGHREVPLCPRCDAEALGKGGRLVPDGYVSRFVFGPDTPRTAPAQRRAPPPTATSSPHARAQAPRPSGEQPRQPEPTPRADAPTVRQAVESFLRSEPAADALTMVMLGQRLGPATRLRALDDPDVQERLAAWFGNTCDAHPEGRRTAAGVALLAAFDHWRDQGWLATDPVGFLR